MDYESHDSSGTGDDFQIYGTGSRAAKGSKIHQLEQEAYSSVLRAFNAQADVISWGKERLLKDLREELKLSNEEHKDLLSRVTADETKRRIRKSRQSEIQQGDRGTSQAAHDALPDPSVSASRKKQKIAPSLPSQSFVGPFPAQPQAVAETNQHFSSAPERGPMMGAKGKKNEAAKEGSVDPLIGRKVRLRWPDDNNFYEAIITRYSSEGRHALVYDIGTQHETWEWVNLSEIPPEDIKWDGEDPGISRHGSYGGDGNEAGRPRDNNNALPSVRDRGLTESQPRKDLPPSQNGIGKKGDDDINLLHTDTLIKEVERVFGASNPDPLELEKAKKVLKEHELALNDAIARLADLSDGDTGMCSDFDLLTDSEAIDEMGSTLARIVTSWRIMSGRLMGYKKRVDSLTEMREKDKALWKIMSGRLCCYKKRVDSLTEMREKDKVVIESLSAQLKVARDKASELPVVSEARDKVTAELKTMTDERDELRIGLKKITKKLSHEKRTGEYFLASDRGYEFAEKMKAEELERYHAEDFLRDATMASADLYEDIVRMIRRHLREEGKIPEDVICSIGGNVSETEESLDVGRPYASESLVAGSTHSDAATRVSDKPSSL